MERQHFLTALQNILTQKQYKVVQYQPRAHFECVEHGCGCEHSHVNNNDVAGALNVLKLGQQVLAKAEQS